MVEIFIEKLKHDIKDLFWHGSPERMDLLEEIWEDFEVL